MKHVLTIAGSDSGGGAGIQADLKTFSALGVYGLSVITAVTAQNTREVRSAVCLDPALIADQIDAVFEDIRIDAVKIGMVGSPSGIRKIAERLRYWKPRCIILDPVMVSKGGSRLLEDEAVKVLYEELLPLASLVTPNLPEAEALTGLSIRSSPAMEKAAVALHEAGASAVLVKGGHLMGDLIESTADDLLYDGKAFHLFSGKRLDARHTHGTGCSLSSAIAALLARGEELPLAVEHAKAWVASGIAEGLAVGKGCGPIHHFHEFFDLEGGRR